MTDFLFEIGSEEIPAGYIHPATKALASALGSLLTENQLDHGDISTAATPRRLTVFIKDVAEQQADRVETVSGPPEQAAFKDGQATKAAEGFAKKNGKTVDDIEVVDTGKGRYCQLTVEVKGQPTPDLLKAALPDIIKKLPFPKTMMWVDKTERFARPLRSLCALWGSDVLDIESHRIKASNVVYGHPFLAKGPITLTNADKHTYLDALRKAYVIADVNERQDNIQADIDAFCKDSGSVVNEPDLVEEVACLVEYPTLVIGEMDEKFLSIPACICETSMKAHQRYFPVYSQDGKLTNKFLSFSNRKSDSNALVKEGNERVLHARLEDGMFFWESDNKKDFAKLGEQLSGVVFYGALGSYADKVARVRNLATFLAQACDCSPELTRDVNRAVSLYRNDLVTECVFEFTELQGTIGKELAAFHGENDQVSLAIEESYLPRYAGDDLPSTTTGSILSIADKVDSMVGFFSIGKVPTGSQDPFALRRQAIGLLRMLLASTINLPLTSILDCSLGLFKCDDKAALMAQLQPFIKERLHGMWLEQGYSHGQIATVIDLPDHSLQSLAKRLDFIKGESQAAHFSDLCAVVQRSANMAKGMSADNANVSADLFDAEEEKRLWRSYERHSEEIQQLIEKADYTKATEAYVNAFRHPINDYFEKVFVAVDDEKLKQNRLSTLYTVHSLYTEKIVDLTKMPKEEIS